MKWLIKAAKQDDSLEGLRQFLGLKRKRIILVVTDHAGALDFMGIS